METATMKRHSLTLTLAVLAIATIPGLVTAQEPPPPPAETVDAGLAAAPVAGESTQDATDDAVLDPAQPDFTLIGLPTTLRLPRGAWSFRVTHRFARPLGQGTFGNLAEDLFGLDAGGLIGLELRYGVLPGWQVGIHRTSDRTIQFFTQFNAIRQREGRPFAIDAFASAEGTNNFKSDDATTTTGEGIRSPALGAIVSTTVAKRAAIYAMPVWVNNTFDLPEELGDDNNTFALGVGTRLRLSSSIYVVAEMMPRLSGYDPGGMHRSFAIEARKGGHSFQINFSNGFGTTMAQMARGGSEDDWYIGFNITRKFF
jgi:hypothetical protein